MRDPRIYAVRAKADAYVSEASPLRNFGRERELFADGSPIIRTYVKFDVDLRPEYVGHVNLLLFNRSNSRAGYKVQLVYGRWSESKINFVNAPAPLPQAVASGFLRARSWKAVDVTSLVAGVRGVTLAITTDGVKRIGFASRETGRRGPRLVVERLPGDTRSTTTSTGAEPEPPRGGPPRKPKQRVWNQFGSGRPVSSDGHRAKPGVLRSAPQASP